MLLQLTLQCHISIFIRMVLIEIQKKEQKASVNLGYNILSILLCFF